MNSTTCKLGDLTSLAEKRNLGGSSREASEGGPRSYGVREAAMRWVKKNKLIADERSEELEFVPQRRACSTCCIKEFLEIENFNQLN